MRLTRTFDMLVIERLRMSHDSSILPASSHQCDPPKRAKLRAGQQLSWMKQQKEKGRPTLTRQANHWQCSSYSKHKQQHPQQQRRLFIVHPFPLDDIELPLKRHSMSRS
ncbi:hypothetical protein PHSY_002532 [Pseudozyma hubeiensis SY62]|uniref:Uncharacterized protein n=1 Tax=Pseudozyma hubeiensis (strain SY62) TaxID=1305764 RepID=R9P1C0_PSEHS|nr:hypothetical protein PHSY_002532 [Pseudozyma hubeiensis SY62]GAC94959.1 hypothetical protein PHSY_002532 [Pseudozyma hubeiensis SY62]